MVARLHKDKEIFARIFICAYLSYMLLCLVHFHPVNLHDSQSRTQISEDFSLSDDGIQSEEFCQICSFFSSISYTPHPVIEFYPFVPQGEISAENQSGHARPFAGTACLRGPPSVHVS